MKKVRRVLQIEVNKNHSMYKFFDEMCFQSKNLYNYANYIIRQEFIKNSNYINYNTMDKLLKQPEHEHIYRLLPVNCTQQILMILDRNWKSFFKAIKDYKKNPSKYLGRPKLPKYKNKDGRNIVVFTYVGCRIRDGLLHFPKYKETLKAPQIDSMKQIRIVPRQNKYVVEIVYEIEVPESKEFNNKIIGIDIGLNNLATIVNNIGLDSFVINGKPVKSINQYYNKQLAYYKSKLKKINKLDWSSRLEKISSRRYNKIKIYFHRSTRYIIDWCVKNNITKIVIGKNKEWKQEIDLGKKTNQNFIQIPFEMLISQLIYKAENVGIEVVLTEENYTSGTSFLDNEMPTKDNYNKNRRIKRGLFKSNKGILINADVNGAYQIIKKVISNAFADEIVGVSLHPTVVNM